MSSDEVAPRGGVYLGLGSNRGDRLAALRAALHGVDALPGTRVLRCSPVLETPAWGGVTHDPFLNCAAEIATAFAPRPLLDALKRLEMELGRVPGPRYGARLIDLDILLFRDELLRDATLAIPHPGLPDRRFVLQPLADLAPGLRVPGLDRTIADLLRACPDITPYPIAAPPLL